MADHGRIIPQGIRAQRGWELRIVHRPSAIEPTFDDAHRILGMRPRYQAPIVP